MADSSIGVHVDDLRLGIKDGLRRAAEMGFVPVEFDATSVEVNPEALSSSGRRHLTRFVDGLGLRLASLAADIPGSRLGDPRTADERIARTCRIVELAADVGVPVVTASLGIVTEGEGGEPCPVVVEALRCIGEMADSRGVTYAIRPSGTGGDGLVRLLEAVACDRVQVGLDPAAMVMSGIDPLGSIDRFVSRVSLVYARDGTVGSSEQAGRETRLGEGEVDLVGLLSWLGAAEYSGPFILRRSDSANPPADLADARDVLGRMLPSS